MKLKMLLLGVTLVLLTPLLTSCATSKVVLYPITNQDIYFEGDRICMSERYFSEVLDARIGK